MTCQPYNRDGDLGRQIRESRSNPVDENPTAPGVHPAAERLVTTQGVLHPVGEPQDVRQRRIGQRPGRRPRHPVRHVRHTVVPDAVDLERRLGVGGRAGRLESATLVNGLVDQQSRGLEQGQLVTGDDLRRSPPGNQDGPDDDIGGGQLRPDRGRVRHQDPDAPAEELVEFTDASRGGVQNGDLGLHPQGDLRCLGADDAATDHQHPTGRDPGHPTQQQARTSLMDSQLGGRSMGGQPSGDLTHRGQQREAGMVLHRLIGDGQGPGLPHHQVGQHRRSQPAFHQAQLEQQVRGDVPHAGLEPHVPADPQRPFRRAVRGRLHRPRHPGKGFHVGRDVLRQVHPDRVLADRRGDDVPRRRLRRARVGVGDHQVDLLRRQLNDGFGRVVHPEDDLQLRVVPRQRVQGCGQHHPADSRECGDPDRPLWFPPVLRDAGRRPFDLLQDPVGVDHELLRRRRQTHPTADAFQKFDADVPLQL